MNDLKRAINSLDEHSVCLCKGESIIFSDKRGVLPLVGFISEGVDLSGFSAADKVVGKAAAMLFIKAGVTSIYAKTLSKSAEAVFNRYGVKYSYNELTDKIINRDGTDICPMEKAVADISDPNAAYIAIVNKLNSLKNK